MFDIIKLMPLKKSKTFLYVLALIIVFLILGVFYYYSKSNKTFTSKEAERLKKEVSKNSAPIIVEEPQVKVAKEISQKTFKDLKETSPDIVKSPNISDSKLREELLKDVKNDNPQNYRIFYNGSSVDAPEVNIRQGDYVTWVNNSNGTKMKIEGKDNWGSILDVPPSKGFTQEFNFKGTFEYSINGKPAGKIIVN